MSEQGWREKLEQDGFVEINVVPLPPPDGVEHMHDVHTAHVVLSGEITIMDSSGTHVYKPGDFIDVPAGTRHTAQGSPEGGSMLVGFKY